MSGCWSIRLHIFFFPATTSRISEWLSASSVNSSTESQGSFNFFVFIRPRYMRLRKRCIDKLIFWVLREAIAGVKLEDSRYNPQGGGLGSVQLSVNLWRSSKFLSPFRSFKVKKSSNQSSSEEQNQAKPASCLDVVPENTLNEAPPPVSASRSLRTGTGFDGGIIEVTNDCTSATLYENEPSEEIDRVNGSNNI
jgi:hypothetical protein